MGQKRKPPARWYWLTRGGVYNDRLRAAMHGRSGVYAVRDLSHRTVIYVGESHTGRAWKTMLRHFQDPSGKFERMGEWVHARPDLVEIRWMRTGDGEAMRAEADWIRLYKPAANILQGFSDGKQDSEEVPF